MQLRSVSAQLVFCLAHGWRGGGRHCSIRVGQASWAGADTQLCSRLPSPRYPTPFPPLSQPPSPFQASCTLDFKLYYSLTFSNRLLPASVFDPIDFWLQLAAYISGILSVLLSDSSSPRISSPPLEKPLNPRNPPQSFKAFKPPAKTESKLYRVTPLVPVHQDGGRHACGDR